MPPDTVFFLSDYGRQDEFVGLVHAVVRRLAPAAAVVDLVHEVPAFDVRAGALALARTVPHLGPGVVLAVVDPGVGSNRRGLLLQSGTGRSYVGPDNGLLLAAAEAEGGVARALTLPGPRSGGATTFDGRDVFAPAAAALCRGEDPGALGAATDPASLVRLPDPVVERGRGPEGAWLRAEVTWVDRFGNVQLALAAAQAEDLTGIALLARPGAEGLLARRVAAFEDLGPGELGIVADASGQLALVAGRASAAGRLGLVPGDLVELSW